MSYFRNINVSYIIRHAFQFIELIPCFLVLTTVFVINKELEQGIVSGKYFWFYFSMGIVAVSLIIAVVRIVRLRSQSGYQIIRISLNDYLVLLFGMITLSVSYFANNSEAATKHILLALLILLYFYFKAVFQTRKVAHYWLPLFLMITGLVEAVWGLMQLYGFAMSQHGLFKLTGSFFNPGPYSCYLAVIWPVALYYLIQYTSSKSASIRLEGEKRFVPFVVVKLSLEGIAFLTFVCILLVLPAGMSRAAWLGGFVSCGVIVFFFLTQRHRIHIEAQSRKISPPLVVVIVGVLIAGCVGMYFLKKDSADGRAFIWKNAVQTVLHHPMGVGIGNFAGSYGEAQAAYFASGKGSEREEYVAGNPDYAFNEYLQICIEHGIIPFILSVGIMGFSLYIGFKRKRIPAIASLIALLITAAMSYPFSVLPFLIVLVFLLAWIHSEEKGMKVSRPASIYVTLFGAILIFICLYNRYPTYDAYKQWRKYSFYIPGTNSNVTEVYRQLYPYLSDQLAFLFEYAQHLSKKELHEESNRLLEKAVRISCDPMLHNVMGKNYQALKQYDKAEQSLIKSTQIVPNRVYPYYLLAYLYLEIGDTEKAKEMAQFVMTKEPKVQSTAVREMRDEMKKILSDE